MKDLADLIERVGGATGPDRELDAAIAVHFKIIAAKMFGLADGYIYEFRVSEDLVNVEVWSTCGDGRDQRQLRRAPNAYTASLDAALGLVERVLPGMHWRLWRSETAKAFAADIGDNDTAYAPTPALALLSSMLRAVEGGD